MIPRENLHDPIELRADAVTRGIIDVNDGIERVMGNRDLYGRMLRRFRSDYQNGALSIRSALAARDTTLAHRLVHTLKGASGMIGAHRLLELASDLEETLRTGAPGERETLASLITEFDKLLHVLDVLIEGSAPSGMAMQVPQRALLADAALLERLLDLLSKRDGAAVDLLQDSQASLRVILGEVTMERVTRAMQDFDFEKALEALGETAYGAGI
jgi:HPt (histidine-containing phosphotransfer) domain-containing protein